MTSSSSSASSSTENVTSPTNTTDNNNEASVGAEEEEVGTRGQASRDMSSMYSEAASLMAAASSQTLDQDKLTKSLNLVASLKKTPSNSVAKSARDKELEKVVVSKEDVDLIVAQLSLTKSLAERTLREHNGKLEDALSALIAV